MCPFLLTVEFLYFLFQCKVILWFPNIWYLYKIMQNQQIFFFFFCLKISVGECPNDTLITKYCLIICIWLIFCFIFCINIQWNYNVDNTWQFVTITRFSKKIKSQILKNHKISIVLFYNLLMSHWGLGLGVWFYYFYYK